MSIPSIACSKLGAHALFLNTAFSKPQLTDVLEREEPKALVFDQEFDGLLGDADVDLERFIAWHEPDEESGDTRIEELVKSGNVQNLSPPGEPGKATILTSGTTGTPKGANRSQPKSMDPIAALLDRIPLKARETTMIAAPLFHSWGFSHFVLGLPLAATGPPRPPGGVLCKGATVWHPRRRRRERETETAPRDAIAWRPAMRRPAPSLRRRLAVLVGAAIAAVIARRVNQRRAEEALQAAKSEAEKQGLTGSGRSEGNTDRSQSARLDEKASGGTPGQYSSGSQTS